MILSAVYEESEGEIKAANTLNALKHNNFVFIEADILEMDKKYPEVDYVFHETEQAGRQVSVLPGAIVSRYTRSIT